MTLWVSHMRDLEVVRRHPVTDAIKDEISPKVAVGVHKELLVNGAEKTRLGALKLYYETQGVMGESGGKHVHMHVPDFAAAKELLRAVREARQQEVGDGR